ncbi:MAG: 2-C-methyl-D-erythritol 2,4-cyclodiphosphate synthase [Paludibacteraceae bacterium]|nr:2-C-methyl-D-erythritol 2,4-cyclodiphosphate synthase [Paludibacteraceae bacterium]
MDRIGFGYDVHRLVEGRRLVLCGVDVPYEKGLLGHSDADVALHALSDALLGAAALRDIGYWFPDTSAEFEGADSRVLLRRVVTMLSEKGYKIGNVDVTICAQRPKLMGYIDEMRRCVAEDLGVDIDCVSIKATTTEKLGFVGTGEGIAAYAVALIGK